MFSALYANRKRPHLARRSKPRVINTRRGFTLVELMIAVMVFSVGMMAILMLQFGAIDAYSAGRDQTIGADVAQRAEAVFKLEVIRANQTTALVNVNSPFQAQTFEQSLTNNPWLWVAVTPQPVDERMMQSPSARYCVFARGDLLNAQASLDTVTRNNGTGPVQQSDLVRAHMAVVYPGANRSFNATTQCATIFTQFNCNGAINTLLDPAIQVGDLAIDTLDDCGLRAIYTSTMIKL